MSLVSTIVVVLVVWTLLSIPLGMLFGAWLKRSAVAARVD